MFGKYAKGILRDVNEKQDHSFFSIAYPFDDLDRFTLGQTQSFKKFHKKISHSCDYFFRVVTYIYNERTNL